MLKHAADIVDILACPSCGGTVIRQMGFRCTDGACSYSHSGFPEVDGQPVLLPPGESVTAVNELLAPATDSHISRHRTRLTQWARRKLLDGAVEIHCERMLQRLNQLLRASSPRPRVLIVGGGEIGMGSELLYADPVTEVVSFDIYKSSSTTLVADAHRIPFQDHTFDAACLQFVLEHVVDPTAVVEEVRRVLRPQGLVYAVTPFLQPVHEGPFDFTRFSHSGHRWLFRWFDEIDSGAAMGPGSVLLQTLDYLARGITRSRKVGKATKLLFFWLRFIETTMSPTYSLDAASAVFFLGSKAKRPLSAAQMKAYYRGADRRGVPGF
jgi:SAM-dependent methyltransferase